MNQDDIELVRQLCTKVGCMMEDASATALLWSDDLPLSDRLNELAKISKEIDALVAAACALLPI